MGSVVKQHFLGDIVDCWSSCDTTGEVLAVSSCPRRQELRVSIGNKAFYMDRDRAAELIPLLQRFVDTGALSEPTQPLGPLEG